jgi:hypothetical protein
MGNLAVAEEFADSDELDVLFKLNATETEPEEDDEEEDEEEEDEEDEEPGGMPH